MKSEEKKERINMLKEERMKRMNRSIKREKDKEKKEKGRKEHGRRKEGRKVQKE